MGFLVSFQRRSVPVRSLVVLVFAAVGLSADARVGSGANCASCHSTSRNAMSLTGFQLTTNLSAGSLKIFQVEPGQSVPIGVKVTDGHNEYGIAIVSLDATGTLDSNHRLISKPDTTWTKRTGYYSLGPKSANQSWTFHLGVLTNTPPDLYLLSMRIAGTGGGRWSEQESFLVEVRRSTPPTPHLAQPSREGSTFACRVVTVAGYTYSLEAQREPGLSPWITTHSIPGDGTSRILSDPEATTPHAVYRVRVE